jgi:cytochrome b561
MAEPGRYTNFAIFLHWLIAAAVVAQFALGWGMQEIAKEPPGQRAFTFNLHKSIGLTIFALMAIRLAWRLRNPPPPLAPMPRWQARLALSNHWLLYAALVLLPVTGYLGSQFSGYPVRFFGLALPSWTGKNPGLKDAMSLAHLSISWVLLAAFAAHLAGVAKHVLVDRDGLLYRMGWGRPRGGPTSPPRAE